VDLDKFGRRCLAEGLDYHRDQGRGGSELQLGVDLLERTPDFPKDGPSS
jgi:hypothetical protein